MSLTTLVLLGWIALLIIALGLAIYLAWQYSQALGTAYQVIELHETIADVNDDLLNRCIGRIQELTAHGDA
jgi:hypothetical protein